VRVVGCIAWGLASSSSWRSDIRFLFFLLSPSIVIETCTDVIRQPSRHSSSVFPFSWANCIEQQKMNGTQNRSWWRNWTRANPERFIQNLIYSVAAVRKQPSELLLWQLVWMCSELTEQWGVGWRRKQRLCCKCCLLHTHTCTHSHTHVHALTHTRALLPSLSLLAVEQQTELLQWHSASSETKHISLPEAKQPLHLHKSLRWSRCTVLRQLYGVFSPAAASHITGL